MEFGFTMREGGQPGDPRPQKMTYGAATKYQLLNARELPVGLAVGLIADRLSSSPIGGARLIASTAPDHALRLSAFAGAEAPVAGSGSTGATYGAAAALQVIRNLSAMFEALDGPRGRNYGAALRWVGRPGVG